MLGLSSLVLNVLFNLPLLRPTVEVIYLGFQNGLWTELSSPEFPRILKSSHLDTKTTKTPSFERHCTARTAQFNTGVTTFSCLVHQLTIHQDFLLTCNIELGLDSTQQSIARLSSWVPSIPFNMPFCSQSWTLAMILLMFFHTHKHKPTHTHFFIFILC